MFQFVAGMLRPSRALAGLALAICVVLQAPAWLSWVFLDEARRRAVLDMTRALRGWSATISSSTERRVVVRGGLRRDGPQCPAAGP